MRFGNVMFALAVAALFGATSAFAEGDPYTLSTCPVTGKELGVRPISEVIDGRDIKFCCNGCPEKFKADQAAYMEKVDAAMIEDQEDSYPLKECVVRGTALGDSPVSFVVNNRLVKTCCASCAAKVKENPEEHIAKLDEAVIEAQLDDYPLKDCIVAGEPLGSMGDPINYVAGNRLVRFCCAGCKRAFDANPANYLAKLDADADEDAGEGE